jgi:hypothetical protein
MSCVSLCMWFELWWLRIYLFLPEPDLSAEFCEGSNKESFIDLTSIYFTAACLDTDVFGTCPEYKIFDFISYQYSKGKLRREYCLPRAFKAKVGRLVLEGNVLIPAWQIKIILLFSDLSALFSFFTSYRIRIKPGSRGMCQVWRPHMRPFQAALWG